MYASDVDTSKIPPSPIGDVHRDGTLDDELKEETNELKEETKRGDIYGDLTNIEETIV